MALLSTVGLGRIVFTENALPAIRAVNHVVDDDAIVIRTHLGAALMSHARGEGAVVAYEADRFDTTQHLGWSVVVVGHAFVVRDPTALARYERQLVPWIERAVDHVLSIHATTVTGTRIAAAAAGTGSDSPRSAAERRCTDPD